MKDNERMISKMEKERKIGQMEQLMKEIIYLEKKKEKEY